MQFESLKNGYIDDVEFGTDGAQVVIRSASRQLQLSSYTLFHKIILRRGRLEEYVEMSTRIPWNYAAP